MAKFLKSHILSRFNHGFFKRKGGVSNKEFYSLNCKFGTNDNTFKIITNRERVSELMKIPPCNLITLKQVHSSKVVQIKNIIKPDSVEGDSMVTAKRGICLGILTADCAPLLFGDPLNKIIGAAHTGWKGLYNDIIENTLKKMIELGSELENICVAVGPCIQKNNYEVGLEFYKKFINKNKLYKKYFSFDKNGKIFFDLPGLISFKLFSTGINKIHTLKRCTFSEKDNFFSYRRNQKNNLGDCGRMISTIKM